MSDGDHGTVPPDLDNRIEHVRPIPPMDARLPIIAQMATRIFVEEKLYRPDQPSRRYAIDQAFLLYGELAIRLAENDR